MSQEAKELQVFKRRLVLFFKHHDPTKVAGVESIMAKCKGREEDFMAALVKKFGPEPDMKAATAALKARLDAYFGHYDPSKLGTTASLAERYGGLEEELLGTLERRYGPEKDVKKSSDAAKVPPKAAAAPAPAAATEPISSSTFSAPRLHAAVVESDSAIVEALKDRLTQFYTKHDESKLQNVTKMATKYAGAENELNTALRKKYGEDLESIPKPIEQSTIQAEEEVAEEEPQYAEDEVAADDGDQGPALVQATTVADAPVAESIERDDVADTSHVAEHVVESEPAVAAGEEEEAAVDGDEYAEDEAEYDADEEEAPAPAAAPPVDVDVSETTAEMSSPQESQNVLKSPSEPTASQFEPMVDGEAPEESEPVMLMPKESSPPGVMNHDAPADEQEVENDEDAALDDDTYGNFAAEIAPEASTDAAAESQDHHGGSVAEEAGPQGASVEDVDDGTANGAEESNHTEKPTGEADAAEPEDQSFEEETEPEIESTYYGPLRVSEAVLMAYYGKHDPQKADALTKATLKGFDGRWEKVFAVVIARYGEDLKDFAAANELPLWEGDGADERNHAVTQEEEEVAMVTDEQLRRRLTDFYRHYDEPLMKTVDSELSSHAGREEELFASLVQRYGPEPVPFDPTEEDYARFGARIARFFEKYDSARASEATELATQWMGKEADLMMDLEAKYGPEPPEQEAKPNVPVVDLGSKMPGAGVPDDDPQLVGIIDRLIRFYGRYDHRRIANANAVARQYYGREEELFTMLVKRYGPEPAAPAARRDSNAAAALTDRLKRFYSHYDPTKLAHVAVVAAQFGGDPKKEMVLMKTLEKKYGPEPSEDDIAKKKETPREINVAPTPMTVDEASNVHNKQAMLRAFDRARLRKYIQQHEAIMGAFPVGTTETDAVTSLLQLSNDNFNDALALLAVKYGPENTACGAAMDRKQQEASASRVAAYFSQYRLPGSAAFLLDVHDLHAHVSLLIEELEPVFGPELKVPAKLRRRLTRFFDKYDPTRLHEADALLRQHSGDEEALFAQLVRIHGPEPRPPSRTRRLVARLYRRHCPEQLHRVDDLMALFEGREEDIVDELRGLGWAVDEEDARLGQSDDEEEGEAAARQARQRELQKGFQERLTAIYTQFAPDKLPEVDRVLAAYSGRESVLFAELERRFGSTALKSPRQPPPQPAETTTSAQPPVASQGDHFLVPHLAQSAPAVEPQNTTSAAPPAEYGTSAAQPGESSESAAFRETPDPSLSASPTSVGPNVVPRISSPTTAYAAGTSTTTLPALVNREQQSRELIDFEEYEEGSALRAQIRGVLESQLWLQDWCAGLGSSNDPEVNPTAPTWYDPLRQLSHMANTVSQ